MPVSLRVPVRLCALTIVALINVGPIVEAAEVPSYCAELNQVATLALAREKFASIIGAAREGNFLDSKVSLPGWGDCSFYGRATYAAHGKVFDEVKACLRGSWAEVEGRASPGYVVLHDERDSASITINTDMTEKGEHVVRLILFLRSR